MDNLNNIPSVGNWGDAASKLNDNFNKVNIAVETINSKYVRNKGYFPTLAALQAAFPSPKIGDIAYVANVASSSGYYIANVVGGAWVETTTVAPAMSINANEYAKHGYSTTPKTLKEVDDEIVQLAGDVEQLESDVNSVAKKIVTGKNILPLAVEGGKYINTGAAITSSGANFIAKSKTIKLEANTTYAVSGSAIYTPTRAAVFDTEGSELGEFITLSSVTGGYTFTTGESKLWFCLNLKTTTGGGGFINGLIQVEKASLPTAYEEYSERLSTDKKSNNELSNNIIAVNSRIDNFENKIIPGKNILPLAVEGGKRISGTNVVSDLINYAGCTPAIKLGANTTYAVSGSALLPPGYTSPRALYLSSSLATSGTAVALEQVTGGYTFTTGSDDLYFRIDLKVTTPGGSVVDGTAQIEEGNSPTTYSPYSEKLATDEKSNNELADEIARFKSTNIRGVYNIPPVNDVHKKFPLFFDHYIKRSKNINVILVGDSVTARDYHTTYFTAEEQTKRPPLMISKNLGSAMYDKLTWQNTQYARFDRYGTFIETGSFLTITPNALNGISAGDGQTGDDWDDISMRPADTRIYTGTEQASVQFVIPEDTYIFNWIYRTDMKGCVSNTVSIAEGNGKVQVYDKATQTWIEANGYVFSMKHPGEQSHRRNTKFQERLRFRCCDKYKGGSFDGRAGAKTVTISKDTSDSRFLYWGIEWSKEPYILTVINAARGGQNIATMLKWMDDDVFDHINDSPDSFTFIVHEIYLNQGQNAYNSSKSIATFLSEWNSYFYSNANAYSYREQSKIGEVPWQKFEALTWNPNPTVYGGGIATSEPFGWLTWESVADGMKTVLDNFLCYLYQYRNDYDETGHSIVNVTMALINEAKAKFGAEWYKAFEPSGVTGDSFYNDVTHPNDYGVAVISRWINAALDFYYF